MPGKHSPQYICAISVQVQMKSWLLVLQSFQRLLWHYLLMLHILLIDRDNFKSYFCRHFISGLILIYGSAWEPNVLNYCVHTTNHYITTTITTTYTATVAHEREPRSYWRECFFYRSTHISGHKYIHTHHTRLEQDSTLIMLPYFIAIFMLYAQIGLAL